MLTSCLSLYFCLLAPPLRTSPIAITLYCAADLPFDLATALLIVPPIIPTCQDKLRSPPCHQIALNSISVILVTPRSGGFLREERRRVEAGKSRSVLTPCCRSGQDRGCRGVGELRLSQKRRVYDNSPTSFLVERERALSGITLSPG